MALVEVRETQSYNSTLDISPVASIKKEAAQQIKNVLVNYAQTLLGEHFPEITFYAKHGKEIIIVKAEGIYVADVNDAVCLEPSQYSGGPYTSHRLFMLRDGLYVFDYDQNTCRAWINSGRLANMECYLRYGETAIREMNRNWNVTSILPGQITSHIH